MMNDRELLELAAKAAGIDLSRYEWENDAFWKFAGDATRRWNPLTDDGDALRLAVKLRLEVQCYPGMAGVIYDDGSIEGAYLQQNPEPDQNDEQATRRAIVRAAADIGRGME